MKWPFRQYLKFSGAERMGLVVLCLAMIILVIVKTTMHFTPLHAVDQVLESKMHAIQQTGPDAFLNMADLPEHQDKNANYTTPLPDTVDINSADSATLVQLVGIGPVISHKILQRRETNGPFTAIDQLRDVGAFSESTLNVLRKHLKFASSTQN